MKLVVAKLLFDKDCCEINLRIPSPEVSKNMVYGFKGVKPIDENWFGEMDLNRSQRIRSGFKLRNFFHNSTNTMSNILKNLLSQYHGQYHDLLRLY